MDPNENQQCLEDQFTGYFSSLVSQPEFKVSRTDHDSRPGIFMDPWPLSRVSMSTQGLSFFDATQHSLDLASQNDQWRSGTSRYNYLDYFNHNVVSNIHISASDVCSSLVSSSLDLNSQVEADMLATSMYNGVSSGNSLYHAIRGPPESPTNSSNKTLNSGNGGGRTKKPGNFSETNSHNSETKKLRTTPRSSCPPLKIRKEKLGDRIAALQRLVAPYGKTDTASVLTESIGYIQFLHDQIQTLSVPYMESSNSKSIRTMQSNSSGRIQAKRDLRSRGLCLVPLSCASCFNSFN